MREEAAEQEANEANEPNDVRMLASVYDDFIRRRVQKTLAHLDSIVAALAEVPGKKTVVLVTQSLPALAGRGFTPGRFLRVTDLPNLLQWQREIYNMRPMVTDIATNASTNGIAIYCLQPEYGFRYAAPGFDSSRRGGTGAVSPSYGRFYEKLSSFKTMEVVAR